MERRTLLFTGAAFLVGALVAAAALYEGPGLVGGSGALTVRVENTGARAAAGLLEVSALDEGYSTRASLDLAPRATRAFDVPRELSGDVFVKLTVSWSADGRTGRGDQGLIVQPDDCRGGERAFVVFHVDTANGVSFGATERGCE